MFSPSPVDVLDWIIQTISSRPLEVVPCANYVNGPFDGRSMSYRKTGSCFDQGVHVTLLLHLAATTMC
jgi:hypothetical protein